MNTTDPLRWLQESSLGHALQGAHHGVAEAAGVVHVLGLVLLLTAVSLTSLRLLGSGLTQQPLADVARAMGPLFWCGLGLTVFTGAVLFLPSALTYQANPAFWPKMVLLGAALALQVWLLHRLPQGRPLASGWARALGASSAVLWFGVGLAGRAIGFL